MLSDWSPKPRVLGLRISMSPVRPRGPRPKCGVGMIGVRRQSGGRLAVPRRTAAPSDQRGPRLFVGGDGGKA